MADGYKLHAFLSEKVVVNEHGCHTALHFGVKAKESQDKVPMLYWLPKLHKKPIKQDVLLILILEQQQNFLKIMLLSTVKRFMKDPARIYFDLLNSGEVLDKLEGRDFNATVCLHMIFLLFTLLYLII